MQCLSACQQHTQHPWLRFLSLRCCYHLNLLSWVADSVFVCSLHCSAGFHDRLLGSLGFQWPQLHFIFLSFPSKSTRSDLGNSSASSACDPWVFACFWVSGPLPMDSESSFLEVLMWAQTQSFWGFYSNFRSQGHNWGLGFKCDLKLRKKFGKQLEGW